MPVILGNKSLIDAWLNGTLSSNFNTVLKPYEDSELAWHPVTPAMGKPSFDGPECIIEIPLKAEENNLISKFFLKKKVDSEQESTSQIVSSSKESIDEDPEVLEGKSSTTDFEEPNESSDAGISLINHNEAEWCGTKRDYESMSDLKPYANNTEKLHTSQVKKKGKLKSTEDKQQTLLSFFGRSS
ncbi:hypothetical protein IFM89_015976 [Coptis chinensis]|uniref:Uncharacterized protein n=1 Tax=Coptis chinensis TaxID=261450 RepID=A0A835LZM8_9MAGN|nr:hypothetical protein IFM89_015976 [Coptis chinensis]